MKKQNLENKIILFHYLGYKKDKFPITWILFFPPGLKSNSIKILKKINNSKRNKLIHGLNLNYLKNDEKNKILNLINNLKFKKNDFEFSGYDIYHNILKKRYKKIIEKCYRTYKKNKVLNLIILEFDSKNKKNESKIQNNNIIKNENKKNALELLKKNYNKGIKIREKMDRIYNKNLKPEEINDALNKYINLFIN